MEFLTGPGRKGTGTRRYEVELSVICMLYCMSRVLRWIKRGCSEHRCRILTVRKKGGKKRLVTNWDDVQIFNALELTDMIYDGVNLIADLN